MLQKRRTSSLLLVLISSTIFSAEFRSGSGSASAYSDELTQTPSYSVCYIIIMRLSWRLDILVHALNISNPIPHHNLQSEVLVQHQ